MAKLWTSIATELSRYRPPDSWLLLVDRVMQTLAELLSHPLLDRAVYSQYAPPYLKTIAASGAILEQCGVRGG